MTQQDIHDYVIHAAKIMGIEITPEQLPGVITNFERTAQFAALLNSFNLPEWLEPAATFSLEEKQNDGDSNRN